MLIKSIKLIESIIPLQKICSRDDHFCKQTSFDLAKNIKIFHEEGKIYFAEKKKLQEKYCNKDSKNNIITDESGNMTFEKETLDALNIDFAQLNSVDIDVNIKKIRLSKLPVGVAPIDIAAIDFMLIEDLTE